MKRYDVLVTGRWGLYVLTPTTFRARRWLKKHLASPVTRVGSGVVCEGSERCRDVVAGLVRGGLSVSVNGVDMKGFGQAAPDAGPPEERP